MGSSCPEHCKGQVGRDRHYRVGLKEGVLEGRDCTKIAESTGSCLNWGKKGKRCGQIEAEKQGGESVRGKKNRTINQYLGLIRIRDREKVRFLEGLWEQTRG